MPQAEQVNSMFASIAGRYDLANRTLSLGIDNLWRRKLIQLVSSRNPQSVADLATGSGDVAIALRKALPEKTSVEGLDFCEPMLDQARIKSTQRKMDNLTFRVGDCLNLPLEDDSVDALTIAFGLRNLEDRQKGLQEMRRVLNPNGGALHVLEFTQPDFWFRPFYYLYLKTLLPLAARILTGNTSAYQYLGNTIEAFPDKKELEEQILQAGFSKVSSIGLTASIVAIHTAEK
jgi:demethylmenaquinone methyltransferase/2-methoxy-6-polyprenyl-1,4-benzoquinol methylase